MTDTQTTVTDQTIYNALRTGKLRPNMIGLRQFEVRFFGEPSDHGDISPDEDACDMVSVIFDDNGRVGSFMHCEHSLTDVAGDEIEGIGAEYADYFEGGGYFPTTSYLSDDPELMGRIVEALSRRCECGNELSYADDTLCEWCSYAEDQPPHVGHWSLFGTWFCDTCNSPYCDLA